MKKTLILLFCILFVSTDNLVFADDGNENKKIDFDRNEEFEDQPRILIPIEGYYFMGDIYLNFYADMSEVEITVVNQTTGATQTTMFDSVGGQAVMTIGNASGSYLIYIVTEDGTTYWGTFQL